MVPILTFYCIAKFIHASDKLGLYTRPTTWVTPKTTCQMEELWATMTKLQRNTFSLGWAMNWEELEDDMHFAYLAGSVPARFVSAYFRITEFEKGLRGYNHEESTSDFDIHLLAKEVRIEMDDEFSSLFDLAKPLLGQMLAMLKNDLPGDLSTLANSPMNSWFGGKSLITAIAYACNHIQQVMEAQFPPLNKLS